MSEQQVEEGGEKQVVPEKKSWFQRALNWLNAETEDEQPPINSFVDLKEVRVKGRDPYSTYSLSYLETWMLIEAHNKTKRMNRRRWEAATGMNPNYIGETWEKLLNSKDE